MIMLMGQDRLSKEDAGNLLDQRVHVFASTQGLRQLTWNFVKVVGGYLGVEIPICLSMETCPCHIDCFERKYDKDFLKDPLLGSDLMDFIHKCVQVFLHSCNMTSIYDVESDPLVEFGGLQKKAERVQWLN